MLIQEPDVRVAPEHRSGPEKVWDAILGVHMDILKILNELKAQREQIDQAILTIERLATGRRGKRRGRPPKWMTAAKEETVEAATFSTKRTVSAAARKKMAEAQKKRWAAKKAQTQ